MSKQNVYDNNELFSNYCSLRNRQGNANQLVEMPALLSLLPDIQDKIILDLGCGQGDHCIEYIKRGAKKVIGIDISEKMIELAKSTNAHEQIEYYQMAIEDISTIKYKFDVVTSSLAVHYIEDYLGMLREVYQLLKNDGYLLFSQEHPLSTCYDDQHGTRWEKDANSVKVSARVLDYCREGVRHTSWFSVDVIKYHRMFSTIVNDLVKVGFLIEKVLEPILSDALMNQYPDFQDNYHRPDFLIIKAVKK